jgi:uncharacterized membrane protein YebE (DUF533 family)
VCDEGAVVLVMTARNRSSVSAGVRPRVWLLALTGILLANGLWGWALLTLAGAIANGVLAYRVFRATTR